jgi:hypothetical protein
MLFSNACHFVFFSVLLLSVNAETIRGTQRRLDKEGEVILGTAANYVILTKAGISTVPGSAITGNIAVSPAAATYMTGFSFTAHSSGRYSTSTQIVGKAFAADNATPIPSHLTVAVGEMETAYTNAAGRTNADARRKNVGGGNLGVEDEDNEFCCGGTNAPLTPGVYTFGSDVTIKESITFEGTGEGEDEGETDVFIIQMTGNLKQIKNTEVILKNGALAKNIFWQVAGTVTVEEGAHMTGILLAKTAVLFKTSSSLDGRVLAQTACDLQMATITQSE